MTTLCLITQHLPMAEEPLLTPVVVATITCDQRLLGHINPSKLLGTLAAKLGLLQYAVIDGEQQEVPGYQFDLFAHAPAKQRELFQR